MQEALNTLWGWSQKWNMQFNLEKCKVMHIGRNNPEYEYHMNGTKLNTTDEEKDIGVWITKNLKPAAVPEGCNTGKSSTKSANKELPL
jgi:hypothetical protein